MPKIPVITIDGLAGTGKGTVGCMLAKDLGWHFLDSGILYRAVAWAIHQYGVDIENSKKLTDFLQTVPIRFAEDENNHKIFWQETDITQAIRSETCGVFASKTSTLPIVRDALMHYQRSCRQLPGLVADGRDMGTVIFKDANMKFFLTASPTERGKRRLLQLQKQGIGASLAEVLTDLARRDKQDQSREISPTKPAKDALIIDTTHLGVHEVFLQIQQEVYRVLFKKVS